MLTVPGKYKFISPVGLASQTTALEGRMFDANRQDRLIINPTTKALVNAAAANLFSMTLADGDMVGGTLQYLIRVQDGLGNNQLIAGVTTFCASRVGATTTVKHTVVTGGQSLANASGTFTVTAGATDAGSGVAVFQVTPTTNLAAQTLFTCEYTVMPIRGTVVIL